MAAFSTSQQSVLATRPFWQPDAEVTQCNKCDSVFGFFLRKHHCRACGLIFCWQCSENTVDLPPEWDYPGPQRVCTDCFLKQVRVLELNRTTKDELLTIQFYLRDSAFYRVRSREVYNMGTRFSPFKTPANVEFFDKSTKQDHILTLLGIENAPLPLTSPANKKKWERILYSLEHPFILPILEADVIVDRKRVAIFRQFQEHGSLRDKIYDCWDPKSPFFKKYPPRVKFSKFDELLGMPMAVKKWKCSSPLKLKFIQSIGRQVLVALLYLKKSKIPYPHLHPGNILMKDKNTCFLSDIENFSCGFKPFYTLTLRNVAPEVECFGNVLYEMAMGFSRFPNILNENENIIFPESCPPQVAEILVEIFTPTESPLTIEQLLEKEFFSSADIGDVASMPNKMQQMTKGMASYLQTCKEASDKQIQEIYDKEIARANDLVKERAKRKQERDAETEKLATIADMAAHGDLGDDHGVIASNRPGDKARRVMSGEIRMVDREKELNDVARRKQMRKARKKAATLTSPPSKSFSSSNNSEPLSPQAKAKSPPPSPSPTPPPPPSKGPPSPPSGGPPPPPGGPPPPPAGGPPKGAPPPSKGRGALLASIQQGKKLKKTKTVDKSVPKHLR